MTAQETLARGPLHDLHTRLGARFVGFAGHEMPVMYRGIKEEHQRVRESAGLFDVSHMSNVRIEGPGAAALLTLCTPSRIDLLEEGAGVYTVLLDENGAIIDDTIVYRTGPEDYYMVPNAGMNVRVTDWLERHARTIEEDITLRDVTASTCIFALQGPRAPHILETLGAPIPDAPRFRAHHAEIGGSPLLVTTTGYTGETGYELFVGRDAGPSIFEALLEAGKDDGLVPSGLGARDTLRLEMGYCLAGHEFKGGRTPLEAGLAWTLKWDHDFIGRDALAAQKEDGGHDRLVGIEVTGRGIPREGYAMKAPDGARIGQVTSGTQSPTLGIPIALAYVEPEYAKAGTHLLVDIRGKGIDAVVVKKPFLRR